MSINMKSFMGAIRRGVKKAAKDTYRAADTFRMQRETAKTNRKSRRNVGKIVERRMRKEGTRGMSMEQKAEMKAKRKKRALKKRGL